MTKFNIILFLLFVLQLNLFSQDVYIQHGKASYYADKFEGKSTANGEIYWHSKLTGAHLSLPFNTNVKVTNLANNKSVIIRINDRGPFVAERIIDVSKSAAIELDMVNTGTADVKIEVVQEQKQDTSYVFDDTNQDTQKDPPPNNIPLDIKPDEYYEISTSRVTPTGFGVQIGSYMEFANLIRLSESISDKYKQNTIVQVATVNNVKFYRVILGSYNTRQEAEQLKAQLQGTFPDCFIFEFNITK
ncbi:MAG: septal ring lytic transglycosylase RlpA family protein [Ignavibacteriales bacterium]|nr:septal ring lytic transglycosylase RlpA family protein [Ignavibacteriales bacterium]